MVNATPGSYLETYRIALPGYSARVNGQAVTPLTSPRGRIEVPLPAAENYVELNYDLPWASVLSRWISFATALACLIALLIRAHPGIGATLLGTVRKERSQAGTIPADGEPLPLLQGHRPAVHGDDLAGDVGGGRGA